MLVSNDNVWPAKGLHPDPMVTFSGLRGGLLGDPTCSLETRSPADAVQDELSGTLFPTLALNDVHSDILVEGARSR